MAGRQGLRVTVERDPPHDQSCAGIPRIVLPEREVPPRRQRAADVRERVAAKIGFDVMKHAVAIDEIELSRRLSFVDRVELHVGVGVVAARKIDAVGRHVRACDGRGRQVHQELPCRRSSPAAVIKNVHRPAPVLPKP